MLERLTDFDKDLMVVMNLSGNHTPFLDGTMWMTSEMMMWLPLYAALLYTTLKDHKKEALPVIVFASLTILLCDQISSGLLKPLVARLRPSHDPTMADLLTFVKGFKAGMYGFPSSHAANCMGLALFFTLLYKNKLTGACLFAWATICAYSRMYLGVHYPMDIAVGTLIGLASGYGCHRLLTAQKTGVWAKLNISGTYTHTSGNITAWATIGTIWCIIWFGSQAGRLMYN